MNRISEEEYFLGIAEWVAKRATCSRDSVGCVLVSIDNKILSTGYNGVPKGHPHCTDTPCPGANYASGEGLDVCEATHAEQNALLQCSDVDKIYACYTTKAPCLTCTKLLMNTSCVQIYTRKEYSEEAKQMWLKNPLSGRKFDVLNA